MSATDQLYKQKNSEVTTYRAAPPVLVPTACYRRHRTPAPDLCMMELYEVPSLLRFYACLPCSVPRGSSSLSGFVSGFVKRYPGSQCRDEILILPIFPSSDILLRGPCVFHLFLPSGPFSHRHRHTRSAKPSRYHAVIVPIFPGSWPAFGPSQIGPEYVFSLSGLDIPLRLESGSEVGAESILG